MKLHFLNRTFLSFTVLFAFVSLNPLFSQNRKDVREILTSKTWYWYDEKYELEEILMQMRYDFSQDSVKSYVVGNKAYENMGATIPYYLSDRKDEYFDDSKVGKAKDGKYLIQGFINAYAMEIISIDENEIKFKAPTIDQGDVIRIYKAVK